MQLRLRLFSTLLFLLYAGISADAAPRTASEAKRLAQKYFTSQAISLRNTPQSAASLTLSLESAPKMKSAQLRGSNAQTADARYYFVYNRGEGEGFVIVSGDDRLAPYIGFADKGHFSSKDMPDNLAAFMEQCRITIDALLASGDADALRALEPQPLGGLRSAVEPLLGDILWDQGYPWNDKTPTSYGLQMPVGCVATAYSQIMRYYKWPDHGEGSHRYYDKFSQQTLEADFTINYDWDNMPGTLKNPYDATDAQKEALSTLAIHAGIAVDMLYSTGGSGAVSANVVRAIKDYFRYDKGATLQRRADYTQKAWEALIRGELDAKRPVFYGGSGSGGGHAFVCDGYNQEGYFHFNWGWAGLSNGYFNLNYLVPEKLGIGGGAGGGFNQRQDIIIGFQPDKTGTSVEYIDTHLMTSGLNVTLKGTDKISLTLDAAVAPDNYKYRGKTTVAFTRVDSKDTIWVEDLARQVNFNTLFAQERYRISGHIVTDIVSEGTWEIFLGHQATRRDGTHFWRANSPEDYESVSAFFSIKKEGDGTYKISPYDMPSRFSLSADLGSIKYSFNQYNRSNFSITMKNSGTKEFHGPIYLASDEGVHFGLVPFCNVIPAIAPSESQELKFDIGHFPYSDNTHNYVLYYIDEFKNRIVMDLPPMKVTPATNFDEAIIMEPQGNALTYDPSKKQLSPITFTRIGDHIDSEDEIGFVWKISKRNSYVDYTSKNMIPLRFDNENKVTLALNVPQSLNVEEGDELVFETIFKNETKDYYIDAMEHHFLIAVVGDPTQTFSVTMDESVNGKISIEGSDLDKVPLGTELIVKVDPSQGYKLKSLLANGMDITRSRRFIVKSNVKLSATFASPAEKVDTDAVLLYPNPATTMINIQGALSLSEIRVYNLTGVLALKARVNAMGNAVLNVETLPQGEYLVVLNASDHRLISRRVIVH